MVEKETLCAPDSFFSVLARKERTRRARWKKEKGARVSNRFLRHAVRGVTSPPARAAARAIDTSSWSRTLGKGISTRGKPEVSPFGRFNEGWSLGGGRIRNLPPPKRFFPPFLGAKKGCRRRPFSLPALPEKSRESCVSACFLFPTESSPDSVTPVCVRAGKVPSVRAGDPLPGHTRAAPDPAAGAGQAAPPLPRSHTPRSPKDARRREAAPQMKREK